MRNRTQSETAAPLAALEEIIVQLVSFIGNMPADQYTQPIAAISGNSIGKHLRHILECMDCLNNGYANGTINYDARPRQEIYEIDIFQAQQKLLLLLEELELKKDQPLSICGDHTNTGEGETMLQTSYFREIIYNVEHAIHHMAIIRIAAEIAFPEIKVPSSFGIAFSTIRHMNSMASA